MGSSRRLSLECAFTARTVLASISSTRAIGTPSWMIWMVQRTASPTEGNEQTAAEMAS